MRLLKSTCKCCVIPLSTVDVILTDFSGERSHIGLGLLGTAGLPADPLFLLLPCPLAGLH